MKAWWRMGDGRDGEDAATAASWTAEEGRWPSDYGGCRDGAEAGRFSWGGRRRWSGGVASLDLVEAEEGGGGAGGNAEIGEMTTRLIFRRN